MTDEIRRSKGVIAIDDSTINALSFPPDNKEGVGYIFPASWGLSSTGMYINNHYNVDKIKEYLDDIEYYPLSGQLLSVENMIFIATNRSRYYRSHYHRNGYHWWITSIWRDYFYRAYYVALQHFVSNGIFTIFTDHPISACYSSCSWKLMNCAVDAAHNVGIENNVLIKFIFSCCYSSPSCANSVIEKNLNYSKSTHRFFDYKKKSNPIGTVYSFSD